MTITFKGFNIILFIIIFIVIYFCYVSYEYLHHLDSIILCQHQSIEANRRPQKGDLLCSIVSKWTFFTLFFISMYLPLVLFISRAVSLWKCRSKRRECKMNISLIFGALIILGLSGLINAQVIHSEIYLYLDILYYLYLIIDEK